MSIENDFKNYLAASINQVDIRFIKRHSGENPTHLRLKPGCGFADVASLTNCIDKLGLKYVLDDRYSRSPDYKGHGLTVSWRGENIGLMLAVQKSGRIKRKSLSPHNLGLSGNEFNDIEKFAKAIQQALIGLEHEKLLWSLICNIRDCTPIVGLHSINSSDQSRIASDFGEVLAAFASVCSGKSVYIPISGNNSVIDYVENGVPISVKSDKGGGKVNLTEYKDLIDTSTDVGKFLYSIASHNKDEFFEYASKLSPLIAKLRDLVGGTSVVQVKNYVQKTKYNDFYNLIKNTKEYRMLGIPVDGRAKELWDKGDTNPFYFTLNTLVNRLWGNNNSSGISDVVVKFLSKPKFIKVKIKNNNIVLEELEFKNVQHWGTCYWSRATAAWHNWMAVEPIRN